MKTFLIDVYNRAYGLAEVENELEAFYEKLDCRCINIVVRKVKGVEFDIMCDDEGLLREDRRPSAFVRDTLEPMLVGNLMFFHHDAEGNLTEISDDEMRLLRNSICWPCIGGDLANHYPALLGISL